ncbi:MAG: hypothetical protein RR921_02365, partial [Mucinivorans sp.]
MDEIDIKYILNTSEFVAESEKIEQAITGVEKSHDQATEDMHDNIKIQKQVLKDLEKSYRELEKATKMTAPGAAQAAMRVELSRAKQEIDSEKQALKELESAQTLYEKNCVSLRTQIMTQRNAMATMTEGTKEYAAAMQRLGELQDKMGDIQAQGRVFADDEKYTRTATEAIQGLSGAMSVGVGVASLFGASQENLAKIQMHLQSVMAISIGVNQVAQVLNKDSYVSHILLAKAKAMVASATNRLSLALGVSNVAAKALMATLTLGLSVAITAVVWAVDKMISSSDEAQRKQKELAEQAAQTQQQFNDSVATNVAKQIVSLKKLQDQWSKLSRFDERLKFVRDNKTAFDELGVSITSVQDAENLLVKNTDAFIASVKAKALSLAYTDLATAEYQNVVKKQLQKEQRQKTITDDDRQVGYDNLNSQYVGKGALSRGAVSRNKDKYIAQGIKKSQDAAVAVIQTEIDDSLKKVDDFFNASKELFDKHTNALLESGIKTNDSQTNQVSASSKPTAADSTKAFEARIEAERKLKEALVNMQFDTEQARIDVLADGL